MEASETGSSNGRGGGGGGDSNGGGHTSSYEPLEGRRTFDTADSPELDGGGPPKDRRRLVFFALMTAGVGFVLPYNRCVQVCVCVIERERERVCRYVCVSVLVARIQLDLILRYICTR